MITVRASSDQGAENIELTINNTTHATHGKTRNPPTPTTKPVPTTSTAKPTTTAKPTSTATPTATAKPTTTATPTTTSTPTTTTGSEPHDTGHTTDTSHDSGSADPSKAGYQGNLQFILDSTIRNRNEDDSPYIDCPAAELFRKAELYGDPLDYEIPRGSYNSDEWFYWVPAMFDGAGSVVVPSKIRFYSKTEMPPGIGKVTTYPDNLQLVGDKDNNVQSNLHLSTFRCNSMFNFYDHCWNGETSTVGDLFAGWNPRSTVNGWTTAAAFRGPSAQTACSRTPSTSRRHGRCDCARTTFRATRPLTPESRSTTSISRRVPSPAISTDRTVQPQGRSVGRPRAVTITALGDIRSG